MSRRDDGRFGGFEGFEYLFSVVRRECQKRAVFPDIGGPVDHCGCQEPVGVLTEYRPAENDLAFTRGRHSRTGSCKTKYMMGLAIMCHARDVMPRMPDRKRLPEEIRYLLSWFWRFRDGQSGSWMPVEPNPPPRDRMSRLSTSTTSGAAILSITSCAMRMPCSTMKGPLPRLTMTTPISPV